MNPPRVHIGYAPGRMSDDETRQIPSERAVRESLYGRDAKAYLDKRKHPFRDEGDRGGSTPPPAGNKALRAIVALLVVIGLGLSGWMLSQNLGKTNGKVTREAPQVISFDPPVTTGLIAPQDLTFNAETAKDVEGIRLRGEGDQYLDTTATLADNADGKHWMIKLQVETGYSGMVTLQVRRGEEEGWYDTEYQFMVDVSSNPAVEVKKDETDEDEEAQRTGDEEKDDDYFNEDEDDYYDHGGETTESPAGEVTAAPETTAAPEPTAAPAETAAAAEGYAEGEEGGLEDLPMGELKTPEPTPEPEEVTPEPTATPALEAAAADEADPSIITGITVWSGVTKKEKNYARPAKDEIKMPDADHYTPRQFGLMTFRGDNFRRNAAVGSLSGTPVKLAQLWRVDGSSARGVNTTYYGYGWTGQAVIARWTKEIREGTNIEEEKKAKKGLQEVIIAGLDGNIRFLDLADGKFTRSSIKLGYAMRGTPSLHTQGYPFMSVGQYARKMKNKTGMIGLRQYTLYTQDATKVIDGLDGKYHRPENDVGSFETSALFDYNSDTMIAVGTNGALYLESLNCNFDYNLKIMKISPSTVMMTNKVKGVKNTALLAVESSPAAYANYVYYADMGGVLRCVDTNTLTPVWAVKTGDSVMAAIAMDLTEDRDLNLYTANMLNNRKKGDSNIQVRRYDALSGREIWCKDIGVYKGKKDKEDVGAKASPVIGQNGLNDYVYFTVTGLSEDGRTQLGLKGEEKSALIAMEKETGTIAWAFGMKSRSESSPIAVYDKRGNGWIVQCEQDGLMHLLDGMTGAEVDVFDLEAQVEASPCAYNNVVVIGTTGKNTAYIYAIELKLEKEEEETDPESDAMPPETAETAEENGTDAAAAGQAEDGGETAPEPEGNEPAVTEEEEWPEMEMDEDDWPEMEIEEGEAEYEEDSGGT